MSNNNNKIINGLFWKLLERFGAFGVQFVVSILLARLLDPSYYGMLTIMNIFVTLANVFIQSGFSTALVQNKNVIEEDYSSVFWVSLLVAGLLYVGLFFAAPVIADFYNAPDIITPFRVITLILPIGAFNSVQVAKVSRAMDFRKLFFGNIGGVVISGAAGIYAALMGMGLWALVIQSLTNVAVACVVMAFIIRWWPRPVCNLQRVKVLFSYGWKLLVSGLLDTLYHDLSSLIVGKKYDTGTLGFYNRGLQFPQTVINPINGAIQSVLLPAMSEQQDEQERVKALVRRSITLGCYVIFPIMAGLAGVAKPLVTLLLTEKWLPCVPYMQVFCISYAFYHVHSSNLQAINAMGRSDIFLKLELLKKGIGLCVLCIGVFCFDTPLAVALCTVATAPISLLINAFPNQKLIGYSIREQVGDLLPSLVAALAMLLVVLSVQLLGLGALATLLIQVAVGVVVYVLLSVVFQLSGWRMCLELLRAIQSKFLRK